jgi:hypothetical protein
MRRPERSLDDFLVDLLRLALHGFRLLPVAGCDLRTIVRLPYCCQLNSAVNAVSYGRRLFFSTHESKSRRSSKYGLRPGTF